MQELSARKDTRPCLICSKEGTRHPVEVLPDGGILFMVAHDNGQICKSAEYASISSVSKPKKSGTSTYIKCPKCGDHGRLNWAYDTQAPKEERPFTFKYVVVHETIPGTWGKEKMKKHRRCQSFTPEQRITILKQVGRYISDPPKPGLVRKIGYNELDRYIEPQPQKQYGDKTKEDNFKAQINRDRSVHAQQKGLVFVPKGKRLTICTECNKPGYKYRTYFQHYNEPPIGKVRLKGKEIGPKYRRCYITKVKAKQNQDSTKTSRKCSVNRKRR